MVETGERRARNRALSPRPAVPQDQLLGNLDPRVAREHHEHVDGQPIRIVDGSPGRGASLADAGAMLYSEVALIVELCAATGRPVDDPDRLTVDVLVVLAHAAGVEVPEELVAAARQGEAQTSAVPRSTLAGLNRELGSRVVKRVARRRVRMILGRELPFGVGVALGGVGNYRTMHALGRTAIKHLRPQ